MQGQEYLNQISASNRPAKKAGSNIFSSKIFIFGAVALILLVLIIAIGAILSGNKGSEKDLNYALILHIDNTDEKIQEFQPNIKSSKLRSDASSLHGVLSNTSSKLASYLEGKYNYKKKDISESTISKAEEAKNELHDELFEAKINGNLDRIFAHKMSYEVSLFLAEEARIMKTSKNEELSTILTTSYDSLEKLYTNFENFSEGK